MITIHLLKLKWMEESNYYPRKNWSSMVLWNCEHPANKKLDLSLVNTESGKYLHRFMVRR